jgi:putative RNA 2'-phosphotransferase
VDRELVKLSRFLSLVLRHAPDRIGLTLDAQGWADVGELVRLAEAHGQPLDRVRLQRIVAESDKQRFALSPDGTRIRANQGHSVDIDLALPPMAPPDRLYHGTADRNVVSIEANGLNAGNRQHVHLSPDRATATKVGARHGRHVVLEVESGAMHRDGHHFFRSDNGVWLTDHVPARYIRFPK